MTTPYRTPTDKAAFTKTAPAVIRPQPIRTDQSNAFAHNTMRVRVPGILQDLILQNPDYPLEIHQAILKLADELEHNAPLPMIKSSHYGAEGWLQALATRQGDSWLSTEWFFAETYLYRYLLEVVDWWRTARDPFTPKKHEELHSAALWDTLDAALAVSADDTLPVDEKLGALLHYNLWGNRIDLSYALAAPHGSAGSTDDLLVDDSEALVRHLLTIDKTGIIDFILDNTGTELATDLVLVDFLLSLGFEHIRLHVKYHPTFVSDTTQYDIISFLTRLYFDRLPSPTHRQLSERIMAGLQKRLEIHPDIFWNSSHFMWEIAPETTLANMLVQSSLVIFKGDANYRRLVDDALWETTTPFAQAVHYCPAPFAALRTMKSDTVVGLPDGLAQTLDTVDPQWRSNGKRGVIQFAAPASAPANASGPGK